MKKLFSLAMGLLMAAALLVGCGNDGGSAGATGAGSSGSTAESTAGGSAPEEGETGDVSGKIVVWGWVEERPILDGFMAAYPDVEIDFVMVDAGDYLTKVQSTLASGGQMPDVLWGEILSRGKIFEMDILEDLSQAPYNIDLSLTEQAVVPTMTDEDGKVLGVEWTVSPAALGYKRNLAVEYLGTDDQHELEAMFTDWDAFIEKGKEVVSQSGGKVSMISSLGDVYYIVNGQSKTPRISNGVVSTQAVTTLFQDIAKFRDAGIVSKIEQWTPAWYASYAGEESIFRPVASWALGGDIEANDPDGAGNWGFMVPPGGGFSWGGLSYSVTKDSQNKAAAWEFIKWISYAEEADDVKKGMNLISSNVGTGDDPYYGEVSDDYFGDVRPLEILVYDVIPTIHINQITPYDTLDIIAIELVLSTMNADYSITAEQAVEIYLEEIQNGAPELVVE